ncbi:hypothetical protein SDC9_58247 [bioreactor metagenome]|jgi:predicted cupin superfamily sugar epimerase|uniref:DUF985 domain-containing protein n=2 Tax=root TaxID=1 RepID=A0A644X6U3_9ZZZZ
MAGMKREVEKLIQKLQLQPLQGEGGYFRRLYTFSDNGAALGSTIYYLMTGQSFSSIHFLPTAEVWYFLEGCEARQLVLQPDGSHTERILGRASDGYDPVITVEGGCWQGTKPVQEDGWTLCATTMVPPYDGQSYRQGDRSLLVQYPSCSSIEEFLSKEE